MKSYIKFLTRNKFYTFIEVVGLVLSLAFAILVGNYAYLHLSIAYEDKGYENIYFLNHKGLFMLGDDDRESLKASVPEIDAATRFSEGFFYNVEIDGAKYDYKGIFVDGDFFDMFPQYEFVAGSADAFNNKQNVIVSERFANTIASSPEAAIGRSFEHEQYGKYGTLVIAAVMKDFGNTILPYYDAIYNFDVKPKHSFPKFMAFGSTLTAFRVVDGTDREDMEAKVLELSRSNYGNRFMNDDDLIVRSLPEAYFYNEARLINHANRDMLIILVIVVAAVLISAIFNFINLNLALSGKRAKEMATRRLVGAGQRDVFMRSLSESVVFTFVSFAFALILATAFEPVFNRLTSLWSETDIPAYIPVSLELTIPRLMIYLAAAVILGVLSGIIPAANTAGFKPVDVIKGRFRTTNKRIFTRIFITVQTIITVVLISMAILMEVQLHHMIRRPMNMSTDNIFMLSPVGGYSFSSQEAFYNELHKLPFVRRVGFTTSIPGRDMVAISMNDIDGKVINICVNVWDSTYFSMAKPHVIEDFGGPSDHSMWVMESTYYALDYSDKEKAMTFPFDVLGHDNPENFGGVLKDIPCNPASSAEVNAHAVTLILPTDEFISFSMLLAIETDSESEEYKEAILNLQKKIADEESTPYIASYISDMLREQLEPAERTIRLIEIFMILSVVLSALGLVAMSTYFSEQKSKEITIRKVFGGTIESETISNVRSYMIMVAVACIIGVPIAVYAAGRYLEQFAYRIESYWWIFILAVILSFAVSLLSVLWQILKVARTNPATELKKE